MKQAEGLRIGAVETCGSQAVTIEFALDGAQRRRYAFVPGQYLTLAVPCDGAVLWRCYSITSTCEELLVHGRLCVLVRRVHSGRASNWLCDHARTGLTLQVLPPAGRFTLRRPIGDIRLFAGGSGIAPVLALAREALDQGASKVSLLYANRDRATSMLTAALHALERAHGARLTVQYRYDDEHGLPSMQSMTQFIHSHPGDDNYLCGPEPFMQAAAQALAICAGAGGGVHRESFDTDDDASAPGSEGGASGTMWVAGAGSVMPRSVPVHAGESLLAAMLRAGISAPHACKVGECASCVCRLEAGEVQRLPNAVLDDDDVAAGWVLACRTHAVSAELRLRFP